MQTLIQNKLEINLKVLQTKLKILQVNIIFIYNVKLEKNPIKKSVNKRSHRPYYHYGLSL